MFLLFIDSEEGALLIDLRNIDKKKFYDDT